MLSQRTRYALRALQHLADRYGEGAIPLSEITRVQNIPSKFLTNILTEMRHAGLVKTMRGKGGGYMLSRSPMEVTYGDIVRLTRGSLALVPCASRHNHTPCENCVQEDRCRVRGVMLLVRDETAKILDQVTLAQKMKSAAEVEVRIGGFSTTP